MKALLAVAASLSLAPAAGATTIADFAGDFQDVNPSTGWSYLWNAGGPLGNATYYASLQWNAAFGGVYAVDPVVFPHAVEGYAALSDGYSHPGVPQPFSKFVIGGYTVQPGEDGVLSISGTVEMLDLNRLPDKSDGLNLVLMLGDNILTSLVVPVTGVFHFSRDLGVVGAGETVFVAVGPGSTELYDAFQIDYDIDSTPVPEPNPLPLLALGLGVLVLGKLAVLR